MNHANPVPMVVKNFSDNPVEFGGFGTKTAQKILLSGKDSFEWFW
jgi:hypothetical protein